MDEGSLDLNGGGGAGGFQFGGGEGMIDFNLGGGKGCLKIFPAFDHPPRPFFLE